MPTRSGHGSNDDWYWGTAAGARRADAYCRLRVALELADGIAFNAVNLPLLS